MRNVQANDIDRSEPEGCRDNTPAGNSGMTAVGRARSEANLVARRLGRVEITPNHVTIQGHSLAASGARVQAIYPNRLNPQLYVLLVGASSAGALSLWNPDWLRDADFDFVIEDSRIPDGTEHGLQSQIQVVGGWFDHRWQIDDSLAVPGNSELRLKSAVLQPDRVIDAGVLASYAATYQIGPGFAVKVKVAGGQCQPRISSSTCSKAR